MFIGGGGATGGGGASWSGEAAAAAVVGSSLMSTVVTLSMTFLTSLIRQTRDKRITDEDVNQGNDDNAMMPVSRSSLGQRKPFSPFTPFVRYPAGSRPEPAGSARSASGANLLSISMACPVELVRLPGQEPE